MGAAESLGGVSPRLRDTDPSLVWALACTDPNAIKVDFTFNSARQCQFPNDWFFEADTLQNIDAKSAFVLLFSKSHEIKKTTAYGNDTVRVTADIQLKMNPYVDPVTSRPSGITQFSVLWGDHLFNVTGVSGNIYLWWANQISSYQRDQHTGIMSKQIHKMSKGMPLLVHTDSHFKILHVFPLIVYDGRVQFIASNRFKYPHKLNAWNPGFPHDTKPAHHSPRATILSEVDVAARRDRQVLPEGERRSFGIRHKVQRSSSTRTRRRRRYDNSESDRDDDDDASRSTNDDDDDPMRADPYHSEATLVEEFDPSNPNNELDTNLDDTGLTDFFSRALRGDDDDDDTTSGSGDDDDNDRESNTVNKEKTIGKELEWDDEILVRQNVTRMTLQSQLHADARRSQAKVKLIVDNAVAAAKTHSVAGKDKGEEEHEEEELDAGMEDELRFVGKKFESESLFKSAQPDSHCITRNTIPSFVPSTTTKAGVMKSATHGIHMHEGNRTNHTYAPILRGVGGGGGNGVK